MRNLNHIYYDHMEIRLYTTAFGVLKIRLFSYSAFWFLCCSSSFIRPLLFLSCFPNSPISELSEIKLPPLSYKSEYVLRHVHTIRFLVPKIGSRRSDDPISRFRLCGENVGRSFLVCSRDPIFRTNKES